jgi:glycosyltransferase involved in cell wall biosynthesis
VTSAAAASVVADGDSGLIVPTGDAVALAAALERLLADAGLRARLGRAARAAVETYGWDDHARRLDSLYRSLAAGGPVPALVDLPPLPH